MSVERKELVAGKLEQPTAEASLSQSVCQPAISAQVCKALLDGEKEVAVKMLHRVDEGQLQQFQREIDVLRLLPRSSNVVQVQACSSPLKAFLAAGKQPCEKIQRTHFS